ARVATRAKARAEALRATRDPGVIVGSSEVERQAGGQLEVLRAAALAEQVEREDVVAQVELQRCVVGEEDAEAEAEVVGGLALVDELGAADAADDVELRRPGPAREQEHLARQDVVADREVVVV